MGDNNFSSLSSHVHVTFSPGPPAWSPCFDLLDSSVCLYCGSSLRICGLVVHTRPVWNLSLLSRCWHSQHQQTSPAYSKWSTSLARQHMKRVWQDCDRIVTGLSRRLLLLVDYCGCWESLESGIKLLSHLPHLPAWACDTVISSNWAIILSHLDQQHSHVSHGQSSFLSGLNTEVIRIPLSQRLIFCTWLCDINLSGRGYVIAEEHEVKVFA